MFKRLKKQYKKIFVGLIVAGLLSTSAYASVIKISDKDILADSKMEQVGTTRWAAYLGAGSVLSKETTNPYQGEQVLRITRGTSNTFAAYQLITTIGKTYQLTGVARSDGISIPTITKYTSNIWSGTNSTSWQSFDITFTATATSLYFAGSSSSPGAYVEYDDLYLTEATQNVEVINYGSVFSDYFFSQNETEARGGVLTNVTISNGSAVVRNDNFNDTDRIVYADAIDPIGTSPFSLRVRFKNSTDLGNFGGFLGVSNTLSPALQNAWLGTYSNGTYGGGIFGISITTGVSVDSEEHEMILTHPGGTGLMKIYIDGVYKSQVSVTPNLVDGDIVIGGISSGAVYAGSVDILDYEVYNKELTQTEITDIYNKPVQPVKVQDFATDFRDPFRSQANSEARGGTVNGDPVWNGDGSLSCDGTGDYVEYDRDTDLEYEGYAVSGCARIDLSSFDNTFVSLFDFTNNLNTTNGGFLLLADDRTGSGRVNTIVATFGTKTGSFKAQVGADNLIPDDEWFHFVATYDNATAGVNLYKNAVLANKNTQGSGSGNYWSDQTSGALCASTTGASAAEVDLKAIKTHKKNLTTDEITNLYIASPCYTN